MSVRDREILVDNCPMRKPFDGVATDPKEVIMYSGFVIKTRHLPMHIFPQCTKLSQHQGCTVKILIFHCGLSNGFTSIVTPVNRRFCDHKMTGALYTARGWIVAKMTGFGVVKGAGPSPM